MILVAAALAGEPDNAVVLGATAGLDYQTSQPFAGVDLVVLPAQVLGPAVTGRISAGVGLDERRPLATAELGFTYGIENPEATIRVGASARATAAGMGGRMPLSFGGTDGVDDYGLLLGGAGLVELEWNPAAPFTIGFKGGVGAVGASYGCDVRPEGFDDCRTWTPGFIGGFIARKRFRSRVALELQIGTTSMLSVGARLGPKARPAP